MNTLTTSQARYQTYGNQTAGTPAGTPDRPVYAVVGFDGSGAARHALDAAARLLNDRPGGMEVVYVAHVPAIAAADPRGDTTAGLLQSFDDATRELSVEVRTQLQDSHLRGAAQHWHFQRRDGAIADQLIAVANDLRARRGPDAAVVIVVGRSEHGYHHVMGSVPQALERHDRFPVIIIP
jgi:nucleotide-binding universal stress UspA family protein